MKPLNNPVKVLLLCAPLIFLLAFVLLEDDLYL